MTNPNNSTTITSHTVATPRLTLHYRQHGTADGLPMLLLHGSYATSRWWEPFMTALPDEILAIAPDLRGCGASERTSTGYSIEDQAADVASFIEALGWDEFDLIGHSSGGAIAMEYALTYVETARTLTLVNTAPIEGVFTPLETYVLLEKMRSDRELLAQALQSLMPTLNLTGDNPKSITYFEQLVDDAQKMEPAAFTALADALNKWNRFGEGRQLTLPTLLIWGDQDIIVDRDAITRTLIAIPGANNLEILRGSGHSPMIEAPVALAELIINFIADDFNEYENLRQLATEESDTEISKPKAQTSAHVLVQPKHIEP